MSEGYTQKVRRAIDLIAGGDAAARDYLVLVSHAARLMDDAVDADHGPVDLHRLFHLLLVEIPANGFFQIHRHALLALHSATLNAWQDATAWEKEPGRKRAHAMVLRDYLTELALFVALAVGGYQHRRAVSLTVRELFLKEED